LANHKADKAQKGNSPKKRTFTSDHDEDEAPAGKGHNRIGGVETPKLKSYIERVERMDVEIKGLTDDRKDIFAEAKANGFDVKTMKQIIKDRKLKAHELAEREYMYSLYARALGMSVEELDDKLD